MKRILFALLLFLFWGPSLPFASAADGTRTITILYTGAVRGTIEPCSA